MVERVKLLRKETSNVVRLVPKQRFADSFVNLLAGLGVPGRDKFMGQQYIYSPLGIGDLETAYRSDWIARKVIDVPAFDMTREWRAWQADNDQIEAIEGVEKALQVQNVVQNALIKARLYGAAVIVIGVESGKPDEPLDLDDIGEGDLKWLHVIPWHQVSAGPIIQDITSEYWATPSYFEAFTQGAATTTFVSGDPATAQSKFIGNVRLHPSRVVRLMGLAPPNPLLQWWGDSVLQPINDTIKAVGLVTGSLATLISELKIDVIKIPNLTDTLSTPGGTEKYLTRFSQANVAKSVINTILLDTAEDWQRIQANLSAVPEVLSTYLQIASGAADVPAGRFLGLPHKGLNVTGDADFRNYYDRLASEQSVILQPAMHRLDEVIIRSALGSRPPDIVYEWNSLWQLSDGDKADIALKKAQAYQVDVNAGMIPEIALAEARINQLIEDGFYPGLEQAIDDAAEAGDTVEEQNTPAPPLLPGAAPTPPAPGGGGPPTPINPTPAPATTPALPAGDEDQFSFPFDGGPGSGRYPAGSGETKEEKSQWTKVEPKAEHGSHYAEVYQHPSGYQVRRASSGGGSKNYSRWTVHSPEGRHLTTWNSKRSAMKWAEGATPSHVKKDAADGGPGSGRYPAGSGEPKEKRGKLRGVSKEYSGRAKAMQRMAARMEAAPEYKPQEYKAAYAAHLAGGPEPDYSAHGLSYTKALELQWEAKGEARKKDAVTDGGPGSGRYPAGSGQAHQVHKVLKSGKLAKDPSTPFGALTHLMSQNEAEAHAEKMMQMNPGSKYVAVPSHEPLPSQEELTRQSRRERSAQRIEGHLKQKWVGPVHDDDESDLEDYNPYHQPGGQSIGGQFAPKGTYGGEGYGGQKEGAKKSYGSALRKLFKKKEAKRAAGGGGARGGESGTAGGGRTSTGGETAAEKKAASEEKKAARESGKGAKQSAAAQKKAEAEEKKAEAERAREQKKAEAERAREAKKSAAEEKKAEAERAKEAKQSAAAEKKAAAEKAREEKKAAAEKAKSEKQKQAKGGGGKKGGGAKAAAPKATKAAAAPKAGKAAAAPKAGKAAKASGGGAKAAAPKAKAAPKATTPKAASTKSTAATAAAKARAAALKAKNTALKAARKAARARSTSAARVKGPKVKSGRVPIAKSAVTRAKASPKLKAARITKSRVRLH